MHALRTISRLLVATVMAVAYLTLSFSYLTHELRHATADSRAAYLDRNVPHSDVIANAASSSNEHSGTGERTGTSICYFCVHCPTLIPVDAITLPVGTVTYHATFTSPQLPEYVEDQCVVIVSDRAPPVRA